MSKVLITGSGDGLGREAAKQLARGGHEVVLHARDEARAQQALAGVPGRPQRSRATSRRSRAPGRWPI
jgi:NAD(P)-dependent dehydrogenase (short-subunit alcohol dehydrogenase family)